MSMLVVDMHGVIIYWNIVIDWNLLMTFHVWVFMFVIDLSAVINWNLWISIERFIRRWVEIF